MNIVLVGSPNVGKSMIFYHLTGKYVTVSNYPGTTVEITYGQFRWKEKIATVIDTPGIYSLFPTSEDERVTRDLLFTEQPDIILHVVDGKNIQRMLPITLQLLEAGFAVILLVNMMDDVRRLGIKLDCNRLAKKLGIPVIPTVSTRGEGLEEVKSLLGKSLTGLNNGEVKKIIKVSYSREIEYKIKLMEKLLQGKYPISKRSLAIFLMQKDEEILRDVMKKENKYTYRKLIKTMENLNNDNYSLVYNITVAHQKKAERILYDCFASEEKKIFLLNNYLSQLCTRPLTGIPILLIVLYIGIYHFVGGVGAGVIVDFLEKIVFRQWLIPIISSWVEGLIPSKALQMLFVGEYGIFTLGVRYAIAIILPIVGTFFFVFSILEDSGYLPRLALLVDRLLKIIGLNGKAIIPLVLGLGCDTMATLTSRILETKRERILTSFLLALAIPCSAQLGVITGLLSNTPQGFYIWLVVIVSVLLSMGYVTGKLIPGEKSGFYMEVPVMRWPKIKNIWRKTLARMEWYFIEILPIFIYSSVVIWLFQISGIFNKLLNYIEPFMKLLGLPSEASVGFLFGFFRRDYGAAGLYDIYNRGILSGDGLIVASVTLTLFVPCIAQLAVMIKELGLKVGFLITGFIIPFAFIVGVLVRMILLVIF